jgi:hypothetical protein
LPKAVLVPKFAAGYIDTGGKFATGVVDWPVSLILVVPFDLKINPRIFEKNSK